MRVTVSNEKSVQLDVLLVEDTLSNGIEPVTRIWSALPRVDRIRLRF
jgi:hypothetical protein